MTLTVLVRRLGRLIVVVETAARDAPDIIGLAHMNVSICFVHIGMICRAYFICLLRQLTSLLTLRVSPTRLNRTRRMFDG